jgi:hypothetical protein
MFEVPQSLIADAAAHVQRTALAKAAGKPDFCTSWPSIREALKQFAPYLPGWGAAIAGILIAIGEQACPHAATTHPKP